MKARLKPSHASCPNCHSSLEIHPIEFGHKVESIWNEVWTECSSCNLTFVLELEVFNKRVIN